MATSRRLKSIQAAVQQQAAQIRPSPTAGAQKVTKVTHPAIRL